MLETAFLTIENREPFEIYDHLLYKPLAQRGWNVTEVPWTKPDVDWSQYDTALIRSTWNYHLYPDRFLQVLENITESGTKLINNIDIVNWNIDKRYLTKLEKKGVPVVPTRWFNHINKSHIINCFKLWDTDEVVMKPNISANAKDTYRIKHSELHHFWDGLKPILEGRLYMIQPYVQSIETTGEYSLFFFNNTFSHAIRKVPESGDFRTQEEHGACISSYQPKAKLIEAGYNTLGALPENPLYVRLDFVKMFGDELRLMEAELIEPSLYFNVDERSPERFADAFVKYLKC